MKRIPRASLVGCLASLTLALLPPRAPGKEEAVAPVGGTVNVTVTAAGATPPPVSLMLCNRTAHVTPVKGKCAHTGGGLIDVAQPTPDVVIVTMTGLAVANAEMRFDLDQQFGVSFDDPKVKLARLTIEGRVIGLLRGEKKGGAEYSDAAATVVCGPVHHTIALPPHQVYGCDSLSVNEHEGPYCLPVGPCCCKYNLNQTFRLAAYSSCCLCKRPSAEFAPDPALDPLWISYWEPFHGVKKDSFGFQVILKVAPDTSAADADKKGAP